MLVQRQRQSRSLVLLIAVSFVLACWYLLSPSPPPPARNIPHHHYHHNPPAAQAPAPAPAPARPAPVTVRRKPEESAANETLGFQEILALSGGPSWRTRGLKAAADLTGLQIRIPPQPPFHPDVVEAFSYLGPQTGRGASTAWIAHIDLIKHVIQSDLDTALILEDDVDWDVSIREQMSRVSGAVRKLTNVPKDDPSPYGHNWDVLWIGHCGEAWDQNFESVIFEDTAVFPNQQYFGWAQSYIAGIGKNKRAVYPSYWPVCSFAYAVNREGARKVLMQAGAGKLQAFDINLQLECRERRLNCISVVPEVMHQYFPAPEYGVKSLVDVGNGEEPGPEDKNFEKVMGSTENILYSARCQAIWGKTCVRK